MTESTPEGKKSIDVLRELVLNGDWAPWTAQEVIRLMPGVQGKATRAYVLLERLVEEGVLESGRGGVYWRVAPGGQQ